MVRPLFFMASVAVTLCAHGCVTDRPFRCDANEECVIGEARGFCPQPARYCAYLDEECPGGLRYEKNAGDGLGGVCVDDIDGFDCGDYCTLGREVCSGTPGFADFDECVVQCERIPFEGEGDSITCRQDRLVAAELEGDIEGCFHGSLSGGTACLSEQSPSCDAYCSAYLEMCVEDFSAYEGFEECATACQGLRPGEPGELEGNTIACRLEALGLGGELADVCSNAAIGTFSDCQDG